MTEIVNVIVPEDCVVNVEERDKKKKEQVDRLEQNRLPE
jgi:hypothetical protein